MFVLDKAESSKHVGLPALIFSSVVSAFTPDNIAAFGPLAMVAIMYMIIGLAMGWIVREVFYVPQDFQYGILVVSPRSFYSMMLPLTA